MSGACRWLMDMAAVLARIDDLIERGDPAFSLRPICITGGFRSRTATERCQLAGGLHHRRRHADDLVFWLTHDRCRRRRGSGAG